MQSKKSYRYMNIAPGKQIVEGYFENWVRKNITHELLEFPIDEYLLPYYTSGLMIKHWSAEDFLGKYFQAMAYAFQYSSNCCAKYRAGDLSLCRLLRNRMDQVIEALMHYLKQDENNIILHMYREPGEFDEFWRLFTVKYSLLIFLTYYDLFKDERALSAAVDVGNRILEEYRPDGGKPINVEGRTVIEGFVLLYQFTENKKYLDFCHHIMDSRVKREFIDEVLERSGGLNLIPACHAYTVMATYVGILDLYMEEDGCPEYLEACEAAVDDIVKKRMHISGGISSIEFFRQDGVLGATPADKIDEACAGAYFMRVCLKLFWITGNTKYIDYLENTFYNSGLGCKNPRDTFFVSYFTPLQGYRAWKKTHLTTGTPCCTASMSREIARVTDMIWTKREQELAILLYNQASFEEDFSTEAGPVHFKIDMITDFPISGKIQIAVRPAKAAPLSISLRVPVWCGHYEAAVGEARYKGNAGRFLTLNRVWTGNDVIEIDMEMTVSLLDGGESFPGFKAIRRGPQLLSVDHTVNPWLSDLNKLRIDTEGQPVLREEDISKLPQGWVGKQVYSCNLVKDAFLVPFAESGQMSSQAVYHTWIHTNDGWLTVDDGDLCYAGEGWHEIRMHMDDFLFVPYQGNRPLDWLNEYCNESFYGGTVHSTKIPGDYMSFTFYGRGIEIFGCGIKDQETVTPCKMDIYLNDEYQGEAFFDDHQMQRRLFVKTDLPLDTYTIKAVCKDQNMFIDYIRYQGAV